MLRSTMLDRYESHTKHCPICKSALERGQAKERRLGIVQTALLGACGASSTALAGLGICALATTLAIPGSVFAITAGLVAATSGTAFGVSKQKALISKNNQQFVFEDYVHADKN